MREQRNNPTTGASQTRQDPVLPWERYQVQDLASDDVESSIITLVSPRSGATFDLLVLVGEFEARGSWALRGAQSCAARLAAACDLDLVAARNQMRVAPAAAARVCVAIDKPVPTQPADTDAPMGASAYPSLGQQRVDALVRLTTTGGGRPAVGDRLVQPGRWRPAVTDRLVQPGVQLG